MKSKILFTVRTAINKSDYRKCIYINALQRRFMQVCLGIYIVMIGAILLITGKLFLTSVEIGIKALIPLIILICISMLVPLTVEYLVNKTYRTDKTGLFRSYQTINFYENSMISTFEETKMTTKMKYNQLDYVIDTNKFIIFFNDESLVFLIRKKDVNKETLNEIIELLKRKIGKKYKKLKRL